MRSFTSSPAPREDSSQGALTTSEMIVVVVVVVVAAVLAAFGMPVFGALEFIVGALCVACRSVRAMRTPQVPPFEAV
ncbi:hypothetical protein ACFWNK_19680 [Streptomyces sp. NPDC058417]|uniref:hypothetical protein n=1 Tax=unclassified Streptomyces TaxID=2593676 RepID=UPI00365C1104